MKKRIVLARKGNRIKIIEQTHSQREFGEDSGGLAFMSSNCMFTLASIDAPESEIYGGRYYLFTRGSDPFQDHKVMDIPSKGWLQQCRIAIREYNERFSHSG